MDLCRYDLGLKDLVSYRPGSSDEDVIRSILIDRTEYALFVKCNPRVIFDIGANIGATSLLFANAYPNACVYAFEPEPKNFELLLENTKSYENVKAFNVAIGRTSGKCVLSASDNEKNFGGFSFHEAGTDSSKQQLVDVIDIRDFIKNENNIPIDLLKIDTEGSEYEILSCLGPNFPPYIMGELHGVNDWKVLDLLCGTHDVSVKKDFTTRCFPFHALRKQS